MFNLTEDPLLSTKNSGYKTAFSIAFQASKPTDTNDPNPADNTPQAISRKIESNPQDDLLS